MFETSNQSNIWGLCESSHIKGDAFDWVSDSSCFILVAQPWFLFALHTHALVEKKMSGLHYLLGNQSGAQHSKKQLRTIKWPSLYDGSEINQANNMFIGCQL